MRKRKARRRTGLFLLLLMVIFAFLTYDSNTRLVTEEFILEYGNLPAAFDGYRLVQLSDIHAAVFGVGNRKLLDSVKKARPNSIVITGDLVSHSDTLDTVYDVVLPLVRSLKTVAPVYYVTGNHEWDNDNVRTLLKLLVQSGVTVLRNDYVRLTLGEDTVILAGVDDPNGPRDMKTPEALIGEIRRAEDNPFIVLLAHRNRYLDRFSRLDIDLVLCGHAHGGIIRLPFAGGLIGPALELFPEYTDGVYTRGNTKMLVSRGIGNGTGVPRFLNNPQIAVAVLRAA